MLTDPDAEFFEELAKYDAVVADLESKLGDVNAERRSHLQSAADFAVGDKVEFRAYRKVDGRRHHVWLRGEVAAVSVCSMGDWLPTRDPYLSISYYVTEYKKDGTLSLKSPAYAHGDGIRKVEVQS